MTVSPEMCVPLSIGGDTFELRTRRNPRARRMTLRLDPRDDCAVLTLPRGVDLERGLTFARGKAGWLAARRAALGPLVSFVDNAVIPLRGDPIRLRHVPGTDRHVRGTARVPVLSDGALHVPGPAGRLGITVRRWLIAEARTTLSARAREKAGMIGRGAPPVRIGDPAARWGSCSSTGRLNFSWRLILAPDFVLDYVAAHEVAHLLEMNHGPKFHDLVRRLTGRRDDGRAWLTREGSRLLRYG